MKIIVVALAIVFVAAIGGVALRHGVAVSAWLHH
jgi:hypothetical protein